MIAVPLLAEPIVPTDDTAIVATFRSGRLPAAERELRSLRQRLAANPTNLVLALDVARRGIERARAEAEPRFLSQAQIALQPWWTQSTPPVEVLILRATIRQSRHDFNDALVDLDAALARDPRQAQAWLTKATIHTVRGEFSAARRAAARLLGHTDDLTMATLAAQIAGLTGQASAACLQLEAVRLGRLRDPARRSPTYSAGNGQSVVDNVQVVWAETLLAETYARLGHSSDAERNFRSALLRAPRDPYLLGAYADFLIDQRRPSEVAPLLHGFTRIDGLRQRLVEAEMQATGVPEPAAVEQLAARFAAARIRGDRVHLREEARFEFRLRKDSANALILARENWQVQREPVDARLLVEIALAAGDRATATEVLTWAEQSGLEDVTLSLAALGQAKRE